MRNARICVPNNRILPVRSGIWFGSPCACYLVIRGTFSEERTKTNYRSYLFRQRDFISIFILPEKGVCLCVSVLMTSQELGYPQNQLGDKSLYPSSAETVLSDSDEDPLVIEAMAGVRDEAVEQEFAKPPKKRRKVDMRVRNWFITWNNYDVGSIHVLLAMKGLTRYMIQEEVGEKGTPHLQGVLVFKHAKLWSTLNNHTKGECVWKVCRDLDAAKVYCSKERTRSGQQWKKGFHVKVDVVDPLEGKELYPWQQEILDMVRGEADDRKVYWYWSSEGNVGKSVLCKHMVLKENAIVVGGAFRDAYYAIMQRVLGNKDVHIVVFALSRSQGNKVSYIAIEGIKDGMFFSPKYESGMCVYNCPHVMVFANEPPDLSMLSKDRWVVNCLDINPEDFMSGYRGPKRGQQYEYDNYGRWKKKEGKGKLPFE